MCSVKTTLIVHLAVWRAARAMATSASSISWREALAMLELAKLVRLAVLAKLTGLAVLVKLAGLAEFAKLVRLAEFLNST